MNDHLSMNTSEQGERSRVIDRLLRHRHELFSDIGKGNGLDSMFLSSLVIAVIGIAAFGLAIAAGPEEYVFMHFLRSAAKMLIIFFAAMTICFPTLYVFSSIAGSTLTMKQVLVVLAVHLALTGLLLVGAVSIIVFFSLVTEGSFMFLAGLNIVIGLLASVLAFIFTVQGMSGILRDHGKSETAGVVTILVLWFVVYAAVFIQLISEFKPYFDVTRW